MDEESTVTWVLLTVSYSYMNLLNCFLIFTFRERGFGMTGSDQAGNLQS